MSDRNREVSVGSAADLGGGREAEVEHDRFGGQ